MMRLIDGDALIEYVKQQYGPEPWEITICRAYLRDFILAIEDAPTVDTERHGHWIHRKSWDKYVCSECSSEEDRPRNYCPECGSKMDYSN